MNATSLQTAIHFLRTFITGRIHIYSGKVSEVVFNETAYYQDDSFLSQFVEQHQLSIDEYILLLLALVPHVEPGFISQIFTEHFPGGGDFPEFGSVKTGNQRGISAPWE